MKEWARQQVSAAIKSTPSKRVRRWLGIGPATVANHEIDHVSMNAEIVVYFSDVPDKSYQLEQWLPMLEKLNVEHRVLLAFRKVSSLRLFKNLTPLPKVFVRRFDDLVSLYEFNDFKVCLYVNNGVSNFQSLSAPRMVHVHISHGESDKLSMVSNQAKAYDKVFVAGQAAIDRHKQVLVDFDLDKLMPIGRPQLDIAFAPTIPPFGGRTIMYAPTWEGENEANNYTSLDLYGPQIVAAIAGIDGARIIYKPHPRIAASVDPRIAKAHNSVLGIINRQNSAGAKHVVALEGNILALLGSASALITDVSSVGLDFLYLHPDKPMILTDRGTNLETLHQEVPVSRACPVIDSDNVSQLPEALDRWLEDETLLPERHRMRSYYFGDRKVGDSTRDFITTVTELIEERQTKLKGYAFHHQASDSSDE